MPVLSKYLSFLEHRYHHKRKIRLTMMYYMMEMLDPVREMWIHPLNVDRVSKGEFYRLYLDQRHFPDKFFQNYRMSTFQFDELLVKIAPRIMKKDTNFRKAITPEEKIMSYAKVNSAYYYEEQRCSCKKKRLFKNNMWSTY